MEPTIFLLEVLVNLVLLLLKMPLLPNWPLRHRMTFPAAVSKILILEREEDLRKIKGHLLQVRVYSVLLTDLEVLVSKEGSLIISFLSFRGTPQA